LPDDETACDPAVDDYVWYEISDNLVGSGEIFIGIWTDLDFSTTAPDYGDITWQIDDITITTP
jgi:hypothetical protein